MARAFEGRDCACAGGTRLVPGFGVVSLVSPEARRGMGDKALGRGEEASGGKVLVFLESTQIGAKGDRDKGHVREKVHYCWLKILATCEAWGSWEALRFMRTRMWIEREQDVFLYV